MQYRHSFHAGNFADVHKHVALLALVAAMQQKAKGFLYLDTHAGEGLYDLGSQEARRSHESDYGIARLRDAQTQDPDIARYLAALQRIRSTSDLGSAVYPGSPLLVASQLRAVDHCVCVESQAQQARALQRAFDRCAATWPVQPRVLQGDGYQQLKAMLPPAQRRGLVLIDPPYEREDEEQQLAEALAASLERFETGVIALWYPVKKRRDTDLWLTRLLRGIIRPALAIELCLRPPETGLSLNGSGMLVINPPWQFDTAAAAWQPVLHELLGATGGSDVRWLVNE